MDLFLALIGFAGLLLIVFLLLKDYVSPAIAFIGVSSAVACILWGVQAAGLNIADALNLSKALGKETHTFGLNEIGALVGKGAASVQKTAALFVFSILFFTILAASGFFRIIIDALLARMSPNAYKVCFLTVIMAAFVHLDGSGAATFLIVLPALSPIYERLGMRKTSLMLLTTAAMGIMNVLPWGGPTLRAATIIGKDANELWHQLMPIQILGLILALVLAFFIARTESKHLKHADLDGIKLSVDRGEYERPKLFVANLIILIAVITLLLASKMPSYYCFMLGSVAALLINYSHKEDAKKVMSKAAAPAFMMYSTLLGAGVLIGMFDKSGIMNKMGEQILGLLPAGSGHLVPLFVGLLAVPMALIFCTDSYFYGVMPVVLAVTNSFGIDPAQIAIIMVIARNCATFISPVVPATLLGCGISGVSIKEHIKTSFFFIWGISIICLAFGYVAGLIPQLF